MKLQSGLFNYVKLFVTVYYCFISTAILLHSYHNHATKTINEGNYSLVLPNNTVN